MPAYFSARTTRRVAAGLIAIAAASVFGLAPQRAGAADPIKVGLSLGLTGANAPNGGQLLLALQIWRDDVNAKGGLLGRPVELVYYDDQTNPSNEVTIYSKLLNVDKVDLLLGPTAPTRSAPRCRCSPSAISPRSACLAPPPIAASITRTTSR
jgi:branched-chain amino acid transport system substrate-binding protein